MKLTLFLLLFSLSFSVNATKTIHIAVASNFYATLKSISHDFTQRTGIKVVISNGATGHLYAQIKRGAPYNLFFSADEARPRQLEEAGLIEKNTRFTYVLGKLVVWSNHKDISTDLTKLDLNQPEFQYFAIANPKTAPYGLAGKKLLQHYGLYEKLNQQHKIVMGGNIGKTFHYVANGNAQIGLVAKSYLINLQKKNKQIKGHFIEVNQNLYPPISQQAVILKGKNTKNVQRFLTYLASLEVKKNMISQGYEVD